MTPMPRFRVSQGMRSKQQSVRSTALAGQRHGGMGTRPAVPVRALAAPAAPVVVVTRGASLTEAVDFPRVVTSLSRALPSDLPRPAPSVQRAGSVMVRFEPGGYLAVSAPARPIRGGPAQPAQPALSG